MPLVPPRPKLTQTLLPFIFLGEGLHESLTRTLGNYLEATGGRLSNKHKTQWEKDIAARMICTNNPAEGPFATVRAFLQMYPSLKLGTVASLSAAIVNGTHRPAHKVPLSLYTPTTPCMYVHILFVCLMPYLAGWDKDGGRGNGGGRVAAADVGSHDIV